MSDAGYGAANGTSYWGMFPGHNCTNYAAYRLNKNGIDASYLRGQGNAYQWGGVAQAHGVAVDGNPRVGDIAWWGANSGGSGSSGHVAYVEQVGNGYIVTSEDNYGGDFHWVKLTPGGYYPTGFIHFGGGSGGGGGTPPGNGGHAIQNPNSGRCIDVPGASTQASTQVQLYDCNGGAAQQWIPVGPTLRVYGTPEMCLDVRGGVFQSGTPVQTYQCNGGVAQNWSVNSNGTITISGFCLDATGAGTANGTLLWIYACNGGVAQQWTGPAIPSGGQAVQNPNSGRCMDVPAASTLMGVQVQLYDCNGGAAQQWLQSGATLRVYANMCLDVRGGVFQSGTPVQTYQCNGGVAQNWSVNSNGTITISGFCLDATGAGTANGTLLWIYACNGGVAQQWTGPAIPSGGQAVQNPNSGRCMDVPAASTLMGVQVQLYDCNGGAAQQWLQSGATLRVYANMCLDVRGGVFQSGTPVQTYQCNGGVAQNWSVNSNGTITISGFCLDATGAGTANGTLLWIYACNGGVAQQWTGLTPINPSVKVSTASLAPAVMGVAYSTTLAATGGTGSESWSVLAGALPAGLAISSAGRISGTATTLGSSSATVKVTDSASPANTATKAFTIKVVAMAVRTTTLPAGTHGTGYSATLVASGGVGTRTWTLAVGSLPTGLDLSTAGVISGTPTIAGTSSFTVNISDSASPANKASKTLSLKIT